MHLGTTIFEEFILLERRHWHCEFARLANLIRPFRFRFHFGLTATRRETAQEEIWKKSLGNLKLVSSYFIHRPVMFHDRFIDLFYPLRIVDVADSDETKYLIAAHCTSIHSRWDRRTLWGRRKKQRRRRWSRPVHCMAAIIMYLNYKDYLTKFVYYFNDFSTELLGFNYYVFQFKTIKM